MTKGEVSMPVRSVALRPSGASRLRVCVDARDGLEYSGRIISPYLPQEIPFTGLIHLLRLMEQFYDQLGYPGATTADRSFAEKAQGDAKSRGKVVRRMTEQTFEQMAGKKQTFTIQVKFRQNSTWQGSITWVEAKKTQLFRSTLEMLKLMEEALEEHPEEELVFATWEQPDAEEDE